MYHTLVVSQARTLFTNLLYNLFNSMAGILDPKTRIFDTYLTQEGRSQLAKGKLKAEYYSFSDGSAIYNPDTINTGSNLDATYRICFEATSLPQDQVTFEADDSGKLAAFRSLDVKILAGEILSGSANEFLTGSSFASQATEILSSGSLRAFQNLRILSTPEFFDQNHNEFLIGTDNISFNISNDMPISASATPSIPLDQLESLFMDKRLSHIPNFKFLPPVNKARIGSVTSSLGVFPSLGQAPFQTFADLEKELNYVRNNGFSQKVTFLETSLQNNLVCQMFEVAGNSMTKLDVIDFGDFIVPKDIDHPTRRVFFVGKVFTNSFGVSTFVNMFTLVFS